MAKGHPTRRRITTELPPSEDAFVARVFELSTWAQKNSQMLILGGIVLALLVGGAIYYSSYRRDQDRQATTALESVQQVVAFGLPEEAEIRLNEFLQRFGDTRYATEAQLLLAQLHLRQARPDQAITVLQEADDSGPLAVQRRLLLARAYEAAARLDDAEREYLAVADAAEMDFQQREALADAARIRSLQGNYSGAVEIYRRILEELDETHPDRGLFEMRLSEAEYAANA